MMWGNLVYVLILATTCWAYDPYDEDILCEYGQGKGELCHNGTGICGEPKRQAWGRNGCSYTCYPGEECIDLPCIPNGGWELFEANETSLGASAYVVCDEGFYTPEQVIIACGEHKRWWPEPCDPCQPIQCNPEQLPDLENGGYAIISLDYAIAYCQHSFFLSPPFFVSECLPNGSWSVPDGCCHKPTCDEGSLPDNFTLVSDNYVGSFAVLECPGSEYVAEGCEWIACQSDETWSTPTGWCVEACCEEPDIPNGYVTVDDATGTGTIHCNSGFELAEGVAVDIECNYETLTFTGLPAVICVDKFCNAQDVPEVTYSNGVMIPADKNNIVIVYSCQNGYVASTTPLQSHCEDGEWTLPTGTCDPIVCDNSTLLDIDYGSWPIQEGVFNEVNTLECEEGYFKVGKGEIKCNHDGSWDESDATCKEECCPPPCIENGFISVSNDDSSVGILDCYGDYEPVETLPDITCDYTTGIWSNIEGLCVNGGGGLRK